jgi:hypothetical protein
LANDPEAGNLFIGGIASTDQKLIEEKKIGAMLTLGKLVVKTENLVKNL